MEKKRGRHLLVRRRVFGLEENPGQKDSQDQPIILLHASGYSAKGVEEEVAGQSL